MPVTKDEILDGCTKVLSFNVPKAYSEQAMRAMDEWAAIQNKEIHDKLQKQIGLEYKATLELAERDARIKELENGLKRIDAISFHKKEWEDMSNINQIAIKLLNTRKG